MFCCTSRGVLSRRLQRWFWGHSFSLFWALLALAVTFGRHHPFSEHRWSGSPPNLICKITIHCLVDHLNPIATCKDHNTLPLSQSTIYQPPTPFCCRSSKMRKNILTKLRSWPGEVMRMWGTQNTAQMVLWMGADSSGDDGLDGSHL